MSHEHGTYDSYQPEPEQDVGLWEQEAEEDPARGQRIASALAYASVGNVVSLAREGETAPDGPEYELAPDEELDFEQEEEEDPDKKPWRPPELEEGFASASSSSSKSEGDFGLLGEDMRQMALGFVYTTTGVPVDEHQ